MTVLLNAGPFEAYGSKSDGVENLGVSGASTKVSSERLTYFAITRISILLEQINCCHDQTWCAETTLNRAGIEICLLHWMEILCTSDAFYCFDFSTLYLTGRNKTCADKNSIEVNRT
jgi:hypothetical protein